MRLRLLCAALWLALVALSAGESAPRNGTTHYLAFCVVFKDEARYLAEWLAFHRLVGVAHFYLYSNESRDRYRAVLAPFEAAGVVTLREWPTRVKGRQAHTQCTRRARQWPRPVLVSASLFDVCLVV